MKKELDLRRYRLITNIEAYNALINRKKFIGEEFDWYYKNTLSKLSVEERIVKKEKSRKMKSLQKELIDVKSSLRKYSIEIKSMKQNIKLLQSKIQVEKNLNLLMDLVKNS